MNIDLLNKTQKQLDECYNKYGSYSSQWEFMGVFMEEVDELIYELRKKEVDLSRVEAEIIDVLTTLIKAHNDIVLKKNIK